MIKKVVLDICLTLASLVLGGFVLIWFAFSYTHFTYDLPQGLLAAGILLLIFNSLAYFAWTRKAPICGFATSVVIALVFIGTCLMAVEVKVVENPWQFTACIVVNLVILCGGALLLGYKSPPLRYVLLFELTVCALTAAVPIFKVYTGKTIVLRTEPINRSEHASYNDAYMLCETAYEINKLPTAGGLYKNGDHVYVTLSDRQGVWSVKSVSKNRPAIVGKDEVLMEANIAGKYRLQGDFVGPASLHYKLRDLPRYLLPGSDEEKRKYLVTLCVGDFGCIVRSVRQVPAKKTPVHLRK